MFTRVLTPCHLSLLEEQFFLETVHSPIDFRVCAGFMMANVVTDQCQEACRQSVE